MNVTPTLNTVLRLMAISFLASFRVLVSRPTLPASSWRNMPATKSS